MFLISNEFLFSDLLIKLKQKVNKFGYAESSSRTLITTKGTKDTKRDFPYSLSILRDLRVLRGEKTLDRFQLEFFNNRVNKYAQHKVINTPEHRSI